MLYLNYNFILLYLWQLFWFYFLTSVILFNFPIVLVPCVTLQSTTDIIVNLTSTVMGSIATYQCKNGLSDIYTTQCTSDGMWKPNLNSSLDCTPPGKITGLMLTSSQASCVFQ